MNASGSNGRTAFPRRRMLKLLLLIAAVIALVYLAIVALGYAYQRQLMYFPSFRDREGLGTEEFVPWRDDEGSFLGYVRLDNDGDSEPPARVVLFFHGNGGEAIDRAWLGEAIPPSHALVLAEHPGYGAAAGSPSQAACFAQAERIHDAATRRWPGAPVTLVGESLGTGVVAYLARQRPVDRLVLISPFTSALDVGKTVFGWLPLGWMMHDTYPSLRYLADSKTPLLVAHGDQDEIVPYPMGRALYDAYRGPKEFCQLRGFGHNNMAYGLLASHDATRFREFLAED